MRLLLIPLLLLTALVLLALSWGGRRWNAATRALVARMDGNRLPRPAVLQSFAAGQIEDLPEPVDRYLQTVLREGQRPIAAAVLVHHGQFRLNDRRKGTSAFASSEQVRMDPPGFVWDGRIALAAGIPVLVHDAYVDGEGVLDASIAGVYSLAAQRGGGELARGDLARFLAEAPWYPTVLLPGAGVRWEPIDAYSARATLRDGNNTASLVFHFGLDGLVEAVRMHDRPRAVDGALVPTRWEGRFWNYAEREGVFVPLDAEVAWDPPSGPLPPYWRGQLDQLRYVFAD